MTIERNVTKRNNSQTSLMLARRGRSYILVFIPITGGGEGGVVHLMLISHISHDNLIRNSPDVGVRASSHRDN